MTKNIQLFEKYLNLFDTSTHLLHELDQEHVVEAKNICEEIMANPTKYTIEEQNYLLGFVVGILSTYEVLSLNFELNNFKKLQS